jgi:hypothetical protein
MKGKRAYLMEEDLYFTEVEREREELYRKEIEKKEARKVKEAFKKFAKSK